MDKFSQEDARILESGCPVLYKTKAGERLLDLQRILKGVVDLQGILKGVVGGTIKLNGVNPTPVSFTASTPAKVIGTEVAPFDLSANNKTLIVTPEASSPEIITFDGGTSGNSKSGATPLTDLSSQTGHKFGVSVNGSEVIEVSLGDLTSLTSGNSIATAIATAINTAFEGSVVTCSWDADSSGKYSIESLMLGKDSSVVITPAVEDSVTTALKLGLIDGGSEVSGDGDFDNYAKVTIDEIVNKINEDATNFVADGFEGKVVIQSKEIGKDSKITIGNGTINSILGLTNGDVELGAQGLGHLCNMLNENNKVSLQQHADGSNKIKKLSITNKTVSGFDIYCETADDTSNVDVIVIEF